MKAIAPLWLAALLAGCVAPAPEVAPVLTPAIQRELELFASYRVGTFHSVPQYSQGKTQVTLRVVRLWPDRKGEFWFYMEYARDGNEAAPYWQRLVRASEVAEGMVEAEFDVPEPASLVGAWKDPHRFDRLDPARLREVPGCRIRFVSMILIVYQGGITGDACRGPAGGHRQSDFSLTSSSLRAWDRAYAEDKRVVWGSNLGPLVMARYACLTDCTADQVPTPDVTASRTANLTPPSAATPSPDAPAVVAQAMDRQLELFASWRVGTFDSIAQKSERSDTSSVKLRVARLWPERNGEFWFYMEYAKDGNDAAPYWQRLVRASVIDGVMVEAEFELPEPASFVGAWKDLHRFDRIDPARLRELPGCRIRFISVMLMLYKGDTTGDECRGPAGGHRKSDFKLDSSSLGAWDRAFDEHGRIIWGAESGPLEMRRYSQVPR